MNFNDYLELNKCKSFQWGLFDCHTFVIDWLVYSYPAIKINPPNYDTEEGAIRFNQEINWYNELNRMFLFDMYDMITIEKNGTLIIVKKDGLECSHIFYNKHVYSVKTVGGIIAVPASLFTPFIKKYEHRSYCITGVK